MDGSRWHVSLDEEQSRFPKQGTWRRGSLGKRSRVLTTPSFLKLSLQPLGFGSPHLAHRLPLCRLTLELSSIPMACISFLHLWAPNSWPFQNSHLSCRTICATAWVSSDANQVQTELISFSPILLILPTKYRSECIIVKCDFCVILKTNQYF